MTLIVALVLGACFTLGVLLLLRAMRPATRDTTQVSCPRCGHANGPPANFCVSCGERLR